jgi:hypothetical protein
MRIVEMAHVATDDRFHLQQTVSGVSIVPCVNSYPGLVYCHQIIADTHALRT